VRLRRQQVAVSTECLARMTLAVPNPRANWTCGPRRRCRAARRNQDSVTTQMFVHGPAYAALDAGRGTAARRRQQSKDWGITLKGLGRLCPNAIQPYLFFLTSPKASAVLSALGSAGVRNRSKLSCRMSLTKRSKIAWMSTYAGCFKKWALIWSRIICTGF
jgi:hypothetical protein